MTMLIKQLDSFLLWKLRPAAAADWIKRALAWKRHTISTQHGIFWVDTASNFGFAIAYRNGNYEPSMLAVLQDLLQPGDVFFDLGANEGFFSVVASKLVHDSGKVIAIEPQQRLLNVLLKNFYLNNCLNIEIACLAIGRGEYFTTFNLAPSTNTGSSGLTRVTKYRVPQETARVTTLNTLIRKFSVEKVRLIKIDIEGGEHDALIGAKELLESHIIDYIALELHPFQLAKQGINSDETIQFLLGCGYTIDIQFPGLILKSPKAQLHKKCNS